jgi:hypothetical protein
MPIHIDSFLDIEKTLGLCEIQINGCYIWGHIRFDVWGAISTLDPSDGTRRTIGARIPDFLRSLFHLLCLRRADVCVLCHPRRIRKEGRNCISKHLYE